MLPLPDHGRTPISLASLGRGGRFVPTHHRAPGFVVRRATCSRPCLRRVMCTVLAEADGFQLWVLSRFVISTCWTLLGIICTPYTSTSVGDWALITVSIPPAVATLWLTCCRTNFPQRVYVALSSCDSQTPAGLSWCIYLLRRSSRLPMLLTWASA